MLWIDRKWLGLTASKFRNFKQKRPNLWNLSCPLCGDSETNVLKARGYVFELDQKLVYKCHNCGKSITFSNLLKHVDPAGHREYVMEKFKDRHVKTIEDFIQPESHPETPSTSVVKLPPMPVTLPSIASLPDNHYARQYIEKRRIPPERWGELFYAEDFKKFMDEQYPDHGKDELVDQDPRIVWFLTDMYGNDNVVCGRALDPYSLRYIKCRIAGDDSRKVFGWNHVQHVDPLYIVEGELDSLFLKNAVASGDSSLDLLAEAITKRLGPFIQFPGDIHGSVAGLVLVYDNEPRNREIVRQMKDAIKHHHAIVIWPDKIPGKDINEMVLAGVDVEKVLKERTYDGLEAQVMFDKWRKI